MPPFLSQEESGEACPFAFGPVLALGDAFDFGESPRA